MSEAGKYEEVSPCSGRWEAATRGSNWEPYTGQGLRTAKVSLSREDTAPTSEDETRDVVR